MDISACSLADNKEKSLFDKEASKLNSSSTNRELFPKFTIDLKLRLQQIDSFGTNEINYRIFDKVIIQANFQANTILPHLHLKKPIFYQMIQTFLDYLDCNQYSLEV